ncbi:MAG TPA: SCO family protein [Anaerolineaceae bacterium]
MLNILRSRWTLPVAGLVIGLAAVIILWDLVRPHTFAGTVMQSPQPAYSFTLTGPGNQPVSLEDLRGKVVLLFFGYTSCPDVCPTTLYEMRAMLDALGSRAAQAQVVFVSVDPEKDTPQRMQAYLANIDSEERFLGLTGDLDTLNEIAAQYGIFFQKRIISETGAYLIDHTATVLLVDGEGYLRVVYPYGTPGEAIAADVRYILKH